MVSAANDDEPPQPSPTIDDPGWTFGVSWAPPAQAQALALGDEALPVAVVGSSAVDDDAAPRSATWDASWRARPPVATEDMPPRASASTPTEVYDGQVASGNVYFGTVDGVEIYDGTIPPQELL
jgi:outer membrane protein assembly factor BamB